MLKIGDHFVIKNEYIGQVMRLDGDEGCIVWRNGTPSRWNVRTDEQPGIDCHVYVSRGVHEAQMAGARKEGAKDNAARVAELEVAISDALNKWGRVAPREVENILRLALAPPTKSDGA